jgi:hypothetical protein
MIYIFDIDETICYYDNERDYTKALPIMKNIEKVNKLYDEGNTIIYWTARGTLTGINWREVTERQLGNWGASYHSLNFKKPNYDFFVCDKAINAETFFEDENTQAH